MRFQQKMFHKLLKIQRHRVDSGIDSVENDYKRKPEGHLVYLSCGHRGQPSRLEEKRISRLMRKSLFIPLLDDMLSQEQVAKKETRQTGLKKV